MSKVVVTCALTGVLTDPAQHHVPVTPEQMAREARAAFDAGATVMHVHFRQQAPGMGHLPSWEPAVALEIEGPHAGLYVGDTHAPDDGQWPLAFLNSYGFTIAAGSNEIQRNILGERGPGLAKSK